MPHANYENLIQSQLYAEFLPNIRSVSVSGRLSSSVDFQTEAAVINEGSSILIRHASSTVYMPLPVNVIPSQIPSLQAGRTAESHNITIRLQPEQDSLRALLELGDENHDPWNAVVLRDSKAISCSACGSNVVLIEAIKSWKDLPSANWAEMMDFWHCHKPHNGPSNTTGKNVDIENKGYSASNTFSAAPGTGFVDTTSLVLNPMDCQSVKPQRFLGNIYSHLCCTGCDEIVGVINEAINSWRLHKLCLQVSLQEVLSNSPLCQQWIAAELLSIMDSQACRRVVISDFLKEESPILVWVFTPDLWFSATSSPAPIRGRAMKVMWKALSEHEHIIMASQVGVEELRLSKTVHRSLLSDLRQNTTMLPADSRQFQDWHVSLLRRMSK